MKETLQCIGSYVHFSVHAYSCKGLKLIFSISQSNIRRPSMVSKTFIFCMNGLHSVHAKLESVPRYSVKYVQPHVICEDKTKTLQGPQYARLGAFKIFSSCHVKHNGN